MHSGFRFSGVFSFQVTLSIVADTLWGTTTENIK